VGWGGFKFVLSRVIAKNLLKTIDLTDPGGGGRAPLVRDSIDLYENILFRFVKGEIKGGKGPNR